MNRTTTSLHVAIVLFGFIIVLLVCRASSSDAQIVPIVFVGGLGGQGLDCRLDHAREPRPWCFHSREWFRIWMNIVKEIPYLSLDCFYENIANFFDPDTKTFHNNEGVSIRGSDFGGVGSVEYVCPYLHKKSQYMHQWIEYYVKEHSYERGVTFRAAPFDWRLGPVEFALKGGSFDQTVTLVEETYELNHNTRVRLMGHSLGSAYLAYFLASHVSAEWKDKYIDSFVSMSGPYDGAFKAVKEAICGDVFQQPMKDTPEWIAITRSVAGVFWMSPTASRSPYADHPFIHTNSRTYSLNQLEDLLRDANATNAYEIYKHVLVGDKMAPPGVPTWCIYGEGLPTQFEWKIPDLMNPTQGTTLLSNLTGDGVVDSASLRLCDSFRGRQKEPVVVWRVPKMEHTVLVSQKETWDYVLFNVTRRKM